MKKEEKIVEFDLSELNLKELIEAYNEISEFLSFLDENVIKSEEKNNE